MKEDELRRDREHGYRCGTGRSPQTLQGRAASGSLGLLNGEGANGEGVVDTRDWA